MKDQVSRLSLFALTACLLTTGSAFSDEVSKAVEVKDAKLVAPQVVDSATKADDGKAKAEAAVTSGKQAPSAESEEQVQENFKRVKALSDPRNKQLAEMKAIADKVEARKKEIFAENKEAAQLDKEIQELRKALDDKNAALITILDSDKKLTELNQSMDSSRDEFVVKQRKIREEIANQHRERRLKEEKLRLAREAAEAEKAKAAEASKQGADPKKAEAEKSK